MGRFVDAEKNQAYRDTLLFFYQSVLKILISSYFIICIFNLPHYYLNGIILDWELKQKLVIYKQG